jgi:hypothetical protein
VEQRARIIRISPLELTMRDVREGLSDFTGGFGFTSTPGSFQLLAIEPPANGLSRPRARVIPLSRTRP